MSRKQSIITLLLCLILVTQISAYAQSVKVITLPNVEVDTLSYPALRILKQLQSHEDEDPAGTDSPRCIPPLRDDHHRTHQPGYKYHARCTQDKSRLTQRKAEKEIGQENLQGRRHFNL